MSRLAPLIVRRPARTLALAVPVPLRRDEFPAPAAPLPAWLDDLRLFATGWIGGLIFFGTLLS